MYVKVEGDRLTLPTGGGGKTGIPKRYPNIVARLTEPAPPTTGRWRSRGMRAATTMPLLSPSGQMISRACGGVVAFDLGIKTLATGVNEQGRVYHIGGFKGHQWYNRQLDKIRSKRDRCQKKSRRYLHLSQVYQRVSERKRNKQRDCLHKASHLIAHRLVESTVVIGDLSQRQMVTKAHQEKYARNRRQRIARSSTTGGCIALCRCLSTSVCTLGKSCIVSMSDTPPKTARVCGSRQDMPLWKRTYRCGTCGLVMDRDENSAVNIRERFLARLGPHTRAACAVCCATNAAINTFSHVLKGRGTTDAG